MLGSNSRAYVLGPIRWLECQLAGTLLEQALPVFLVVS